MVNLNITISLNEELQFQQASLPNTQRISEGY